jgi:hypothetical protein
MATSCVMNVKKVTASELRGSMKNRLREARNNRVLLVQNRRQPEKYVVDKGWLDNFFIERDSILATITVLADRKLTDRLVELAKTIDDDVENDRLLTMDEVFA